MTRKRKPKWWWVSEYRCGCSADSTRVRDMLNYCATHGADRIRLTKFPARLATTQRTADTK